MPIEINKYTAEDFSQQLMTVNEFINRFVDKSSAEVGYLAQYQLFEQIPHLRRDLIVPDYCYCLEEEGAFENYDAQ